MVRFGRGTRRPTAIAVGASFDIHVARVVLDGVPSVGPEELAAAIQDALADALSAGPDALATPTSSNVSFALGSVLHLGAAPFAQQLGGAIAPAVLGMAGRPPDGPRGDPR
jgi:hypothetical protein